MRRFILLAFAVLTASANALPMHFTAQPRAVGFRIDAPGKWHRDAIPLHYKLGEKQTLTGMSSWTEDQRDPRKAAEKLLATLKPKATEKIGKIRLGSIVGVVVKGQHEFEIHAAQGHTSIYIHYVDERDNAEDGAEILKGIEKSFTWSR